MPFDPNVPVSDVPMEYNVRLGHPPPDNDVPGITAVDTPRSRSPSPCDKKLQNRYLNRLRWNQDRQSICHRRRRRRDLDPDPPANRLHK